MVLASAGHWGNMAASDMSAPWTAVMRCGLSSFNCELAERCPRYTARPAWKAQVEFRGTEVTCPSSAAADDLPTISHTIDAMLHNRHLGHDISLIGPTDDSMRL